MDASDRDEAPRPGVAASPSAPARYVDLGGAFARGIVWTMAMRWGLRLMGLLSTVIVARLLSPTDYGLIAMASLVITLAQVLLESDATNSLLREPDATESFWHSTWTVRFFQSLALASVIALAAPIAATYFREPRLSAVIWMLALGIAIDGMGSIGPLLARKGLDYGAEVKILLASRIVNLVVTIGLALWLRDYWALVFGSLAGTASQWVLGYASHPYRPRVDFTHARRILSFSSWMIATGAGTFAARKLDGFVIGRIGTAADLGSYNVGMELGQMVTAELGSPLSRTLVPVLSTLHHDPERMRAAIMKTTSAVNTATLPAGIGLAAVAPVLVPILLGPKWTSAIPILIAFSLLGAVRYLTGPYFALFMTLGRSRVLAILAWVEFAAFAVAIAFFYDLGIFGVIYARMVGTVVAVSTWLILGQMNGLRFSVFLQVTWRPVLSCALMAACILALPVGALPPVVQLVALVATGALVYIVSIAILWVGVGKPDGLESRVADGLLKLSRDGRLGRWRASSDGR